MYKIYTYTERENKQMHYIRTSLKSVLYNTILLTVRIYLTLRLYTIQTDNQPFNCMTANRNEIDNKMFHSQNVRKKK